MQRKYKFNQPTNPQKEQTMTKITQEPGFQAIKNAHQMAKHAHHSIKTANQVARITHQACEEFLKSIKMRDETLEVGIGSLNFLLDNALNHINETLDHINEALDHINNNQSQ